MKKLPRAILFDWDGTLADTRHAVVFCMEHILSLYNKEPWNIVRKKYRDKNKSLKENFPNFFGEKALEAYKQYLTYYQQYGISQVHLSNHAKEFLHLCITKGISLYITSSKEKSLLLSEVQQLLPNIPFKRILGDGDSKHNKPSPDPVFTALYNENIEINEKNVWLVGDSLQDTDCALNAGILPILINDSAVMWDNEDLNNLTMSKIISVSSFKELADYLISSYDE